MSESAAMSKNADSHWSRERSLAWASAKTNEAMARKTERTNRRARRG